MKNTHSVHAFTVLRRIARPPVSILILLATALWVTSCGSTATLTLRTDGFATISILAEVPAVVDVKIRGFMSSQELASGTGQPGKTSASGGSAAARSRSAAGQAPLFDADAIGKAMKARKALVLKSVTPTASSYSGEFTLGTLGDTLKADPALASLMSLSTAGTITTCTLSLSRDNATALADLFPGIDPYLLEALQPPALFPNPVTTGEYRSMLSALLGQAAVQAMDRLACTFEIATPGDITTVIGGERISARRARMSIGTIAAMVLETPVRFSVSWRN